MKNFVPALKTGGVISGFAALGYGAFIYAVRFGNMDPFAKFRGVNSVDMQTGLELKDVSIAEYHKGKLTAKARVGRLTVSQDRSVLELSKVQNGVFEGSPNVRFASERGAWNVATQDLQLAGLTRVAGKDFDVQTAGAQFNRATQSIAVPGQLHGTLLGGKFSATALSYSVKTGDTSAHLLRWQGKPPVNAELQKEAGQIAPGQGDVIARAWDIECDYSQKKGNLSIYNNAKATDGELLVYAPKVEWERTSDVLTATGRISYFSGKADVMADKVVIYRKEKRAYFTGNVVMLVKSKKDQDKPPVKEEVPAVKEEAFNEQFKLPDKPSVISAADKEKVEQLRSGKNVREYPLHLQAQEITYWYAKGDRHAIFSGSPVSRQEFPSGQWRMGWSYDGKYDGEKEILHLTSDASKRQVRYKNSVGDIAQASKAQFSTKDTESEDDEDLQLWDVSGIFKDTSGEDTREAKSPDGKPAPPAATPPPSTTPPTTPPVKTNP
jgi:lipopolysaccharide export system protein LptA